MIDCLPVDNTYTNYYLDIQNIQSAMHHKMLFIIYQAAILNLSIFRKTLNLLGLAAIGFGISTKK